MSFRGGVSFRTMHNKFKQRRKSTAKATAKATSKKRNKRQTRRKRPLKKRKYIVTRKNGMLIETDGRGGTHPLT